MKKVMMLLAYTAMLYGKPAISDPQQPIRDAIAYFEAKGGAVTEQELQEIKQKAQDIIQPDEAKRLTVKVGMRVLEKSLLTQEYEHNLADHMTPDDIGVALEVIDYVRTAVDTSADQLQQVLGNTQNAQDFTTQLYHSFAYMLTLLLEVEKAIEKVEFKVKANKTYDDTMALFKLHISPADMLQHLYSLKGGVYEKVPVA